MEEPQNDTKVSFSIMENEDLHIITANDEIAGEIAADGFTEIE